MDLHSTHSFPVDPNRLIEAMLDPGFYAGLRLDDLEPPEVLERDISGATALLRVAYAYTGTLDPIARTVLGTERITWVNELQLDTENHTGRLTIVPGVQAGRVSCSGEVAVAETPAGATRSIAGRLSIAIPLLGGRAERAIAPGILRRLDAEAAALEAYLASG